VYLVCQDKKNVENNPDILTLRPAGNRDNPLGALNVRRREIGLVFFRPVR
jgi:hypothetical protein